MLGLCQRFGCLPSQLDREPTRLPGGRPGLLKLLMIERLGNPQKRGDDNDDDARWDMDMGEGW